MSNYCQNCGSKRKTSDKFCTKCGNKFQFSKYTNYEISLLSLFKKPRGLENPGWQQAWTDSLQKSYMDVIQRFLRNDDLSMHKYSDDELFNLLTISKLKPILKKNNMKVSGKKQELIDRLVQSGEIGSHHVDHTNLKHYIITKQGRAIVLPYLKNLELTKEKASTRVTEFIAKKEYSKAYEVVTEYKMQLPSTMRGEGLSVGIGLGTNAKNSEKLKVEIGKWRLEQIQAVKNIAKEFPRDMVQKAYEHILWNKSIRGSPFTPSFISAFMTSSNTIYNKNELDQIKKKKWITTVSVSSVHNSCTECKNLSSKSPFKLNELPFIPNPQCTNSNYNFCRCTYTANLD